MPNRRLRKMKKSVEILNRLIRDGDKNGAIRQMERHKMTPEYFQDLLNVFADFISRQNIAERVMYFPVLQAAACGQVDIMNALINRGFDPEAQDSTRVYCTRRAVHWACYEGHLHIVKCLVTDHSVDLEARDESGRAPLRIAFDYGHCDIVKCLIVSGANIVFYRLFKSTTALHDCVLHFKPDIVHYVLSKGVDVDVRCGFETTPLFETMNAEFGYENALVLLDMGVDVNAKDRHGVTTFLLTALEHDVNLMRLLVSRGADPCAVDNDGWTVLHCAFCNMPDDADNEVIKYLVVELGLECLNTRDSEGMTPVSVALERAKGWSKRIYELLVNYGCNITDEFDLLDFHWQEDLERYIPNPVEFFQHLQQRTSPPRSLQDLAVVKIRRQLGVRLQSAVTELPLPEILKDLIRIKKTDDDE